MSEISTEHTMSWFQSPRIEQQSGLLSYHLHSSSLNSYIDYQKQSSSGNKITPAILFIIIILAIIFFISGLLHLLVRFLVKHRSSSSVSESNRYPEITGSDTFQRQLQQLFHLHDSGLDQAYIDALPVFLYKEIMGQKEPFDCAVCLCEFSEKDRLRLLPLCSHAFHIDCIDTWLLSNSTCPLCRGSLFTPGAPIENAVFEFEHFRSCEQDCGVSDISHKPAAENAMIVNSRRVFSVRLGRFRSSNNDQESEPTQSGLENGESSCSSNSKNLDARRCFSMGSYQYVVADMDLQVTLCPPTGASTRATDTKIVARKISQNGNLEGDLEGKKINRSKGESFSVSKIWQWSKKDRLPCSSQTQIGSSVTVSSNLP